jgi:hypothetical protein
MASLCLRKAQINYLKGNKLRRGLKCGNLSTVLGLQNNSTLFLTWYLYSFGPHSLWWFLRLSSDRSQAMAFIYHILHILTPSSSGSRYHGSEYIL